MQIKIGSVLTIRGKRFYCEAITHSKRTKLANAQDVEMAKHDYKNQTNYTWLSKVYQDFEPGDIIELESEEVSFKEVNGFDWQTIFTYDKITKETKTDGTERLTQGSSEQAPDQQVENAGRGDEGGSCVGEPNPGEAGDSLHGCGQGGEGGPAGGTTGSEGG